MARYTGRDRNDLEYEKFEAGTDSQALVRTKIVDSTNLETTPSGLRTAMEHTTLDVGDTAIALPATALTDRNAITIFNLDTTNTLYIGNSDVTADSVVGATSGYPVLPQATVNIDITDNVIIYGRAATGITIRVLVFEVA